jgi:hypothetical protein
MAPFGKIDQQSYPIARRCTAERIHLRSVNLKAG